MIPLHPRIVHFPVALLISAAFLGILALIFKSKRNILKEVLFWNLALGIVGAIAAIITGLSQEDTLVHNEAIHSLMETHEELGFVFSSIFLVLFIWMLLRKSKMKTTELTAIVVMLILTSGLLVYSAHLGGEMVYKQGAGVIPMKSIISAEEHEHSHTGSATEHADENATHPKLKNSSQQTGDNE